MPTKKKNHEYSALGFGLATISGLVVGGASAVATAKVGFLQTKTGQIAMDLGLLAVAFGIGWGTNGKRSDVAYGMAGSVANSYGVLLSSHIPGMNGLTVGPMQGITVGPMQGSPEIQMLGETFDLMNGGVGSTPTHMKGEYANM